jgi:hypothetical protein
MPPDLFCFSCISGRALYFCPGQPQPKNLLPTACSVAGIIDPYHHTQIIDWDAVSLTFCLRWPQTVILLIFASWVVGTTGMYYCTQWDIFIITFFLLIHMSTLFILDNKILILYSYNLPTKQSAY